MLGKNKERDQDVQRCFCYMYSCLHIGVICVFVLELFDFTLTWTHLWWRTMTGLICVLWISHWDTWQCMIADAQDCQRSYNHKVALDSLLFRCVTLAGVCGMHSETIPICHSEVCFGSQRLKSQSKFRRFVMGHGRPWLECIWWHKPGFKLQSQH